MGTGYSALRCILRGNRRVRTLRPRTDVMELWGRFQQPIPSASTDEEGGWGVERTHHWAQQPTRSPTKNPWNATQSGSHSESQHDPTRVALQPRSRQSSVSSKIVYRRPTALQRLSTVEPSWFWYQQKRRTFVNMKTYKSQLSCFAEPVPSSDGLLHRGW